MPRRRRVDHRADPLLGVAGVVGGAEPGGDGRRLTGGRRSRYRASVLAGPLMSGPRGRVGDRVLTDMARHELRATGAYVQQQGICPSELIQRELLMAQLGATGMSNKEIGERLSVSTRTIWRSSVPDISQAGNQIPGRLRDALESLQS
jgi:regulatory LuxR family protein